MTLFNPIPGNDDIARILAMPSPVEPFVWGSGGAQITPEDLARRRAIADQQTMGDYSPVEHWAQGLGRVADGLIGGIETRRLDRQSAEMQAQQQQLLQSALGKDADLAPLLANKATASIVDNLLQQRNPKAAQPHYWETNNGSLGMIGPDGTPRIAYEDPTPKINWIQADNGDGTKSLIPVGPNGPMMQGGGDPFSPSAGASIPTGSPLAPAANSQTVDGKQYWQINGKWYDNPEGR